MCSFRPGKNGILLNSLVCLEFWPSRIDELCRMSHFEKKKQWGEVGSERHSTCILACWMNHVWYIWISLLMVCVSDAFVWLSFPQHLGGSLVWLDAFEKVLVFVGREYDNGKSKSAHIGNFPRNCHQVESSHWDFVGDTDSGWRKIHGHDFRIRDPQIFHLTWSSSSFWILEFHTPKFWFGFASA